jgi:hypothetical protein
MYFLSSLYLYFLLFVNIVGVITTYSLGMINPLLCTLNSNILILIEIKTKNKKWFFSLKQYLFTIGIESRRTYPLIICLSVNGTEKKEENRLIDQEEDDTVSWRQICTAVFSCCFSLLVKQTKKATTCALNYCRQRRLEVRRTAAMKQQ